MATAIQLTHHEVQGLCQNYLRDNYEPESIAAEKNFKLNVIRYKLNPISDSPSGFLGHHRFLVVDVHMEKNGRIEINKIRFFIKAAPAEIASRMEYIEEFGVFKKEIVVCRDVLPKLQDIFAGVAPKCYYADNNLLVFEDLQYRGYRMAAARDGLLDYKHLQCALKSLAAMHAASIVFELREKRTIVDIFPEAVIENAYPALPLPPEHVRYQNFANGVEVFLELIKQMPKYHSHMDVIQEQLYPKMSTIFKLAQTSKHFLNVFSHADLWANNIMFAYDKSNEIPIQCRFVDYQLARYAPPMLDVITILTIPTSREFRSKHLMDLLGDYYRYMGEFLLREQLLIEDFLSPKEFWQTFEEYRICGLIESCLFSHLTILPPSLTQSLTSSTDGFSDFFNRKRVDLCLAAFKSDQIYRERLSDMLEDVVDNYILNNANGMSQD
uniref:CHK kinase-like domain-containing protein n=1 Tax=Stomoxys calcitrans TaxID=35570 RepID=A0A1I8PWT3_STOCA